MKIMTKPTTPIDHDMITPKTHGLLPILDRLAHNSENAKLLMWKVYLVDWRHFLRTGRHAIEVEWTLTTRGPENEQMLKDIRIYLESKANIVRPSFFKRLMKAAKNSLMGRNQSAEEVGPDVSNAIKHVGKVIKNLTDAQLIQLVYSTWPIFVFGDKPNHSNFEAIVAHYKKNVPDQTQHVLA